MDMYAFTGLIAGFVLAGLVVWLIAWVLTEYRGR